MLTFTRKNGQSVVVRVAGHPPLTITFLGSRPGKCQLAFDGPQEYHILREELTSRDSIPLLTSRDAPSTRCGESQSDITAMCGS